MENATEIKAAPVASETCSADTSGGGLNRRTLYIGLGIGAAAGLFLGWDWLVAVGAASLIIAAAPCLVMCALGMCAMRRGQDKKTEVPVKSDSVNAHAPITKAISDDVAVASTAADDPTTRVAANDVLVAKAAAAPAPEARV